MEQLSSLQRVAKRMQECAIKLKLYIYIREHFGIIVQLPSFEQSRFLDQFHVDRRH